MITLASEGAEAGRNFKGRGNNYNDSMVQTGGDEGGMKWSNSGDILAEMM